MSLPFLSLGQAGLDQRAEGSQGQETHVQPYTAPHGAMRYGGSGSVSPGSGFLTIRGKVRTKWALSILPEPDR